MTGNIRELVIGRNAPTLSEPLREASVEVFFSPLLAGFLLPSIHRFRDLPALFPHGGRGEKKANPLSGSLFFVRQQRDREHVAGEACKLMLAISPERRR
ncbi:hypothetical protein [Paraburkholderia sp. ZP32-5]|uniref:hypothetical protein n=1 Tax=Paraburkholderia sp. ZP32-5 TaxID=2883245 RepID=UPI001F2FDEEE|nr:hypothetical protein [Paraburkholderia sp. ZP32-5]